MAENLLEIRNVSKIFRIGGMLSRKKLTAIDDVSLTITNERPVILSIVGESGCGKSTLCKMILRVHKPDMGEIYLNGKRYSDKRAYDPLQFRLDVQPIFQNPYESFSARKTVDTYLFNTALRLGICKTRKEAEERIDEVLKSVGLSLSVVKGKYPTQFSGGELQRVKLASKLDERGQIFILDEPTDGLHLDDIRRLMKLFNRMTDQGNTLFIIEHSLDVMKDADYIVELGPGGGLAGGSLLFAGTPKEMLEAERSVTREYLRESL